jgi:glycerol-3-phosphate acyltransferase PlsY
MKLALLMIAAFLLGSVPTGQILARSRGLNLKNTGSGNIGATNVLRTMGRLPALFTLIGDIIKGVLPVVAAHYLHCGVIEEGITGLAAVLGHNFSVFMKFRGGKGVATSLGVLFVYAPLSALATVAIWLGTVAATRYSSLGAIVSFCCLPVAVYLLDSIEKLPIVVSMSIIMLVRHRENISRLVSGTESKVGGAA